MKRTTKGLKPKDRALAVAKPNKQLRANQWQSTPQQVQFMQAWLDPESATFGNAYKSAKLAGYSDNYAQHLTIPAINNKWLDEFRRRTLLGTDHIKQGIQQLAIKAKDSRSPDDTRLKAYEILARISGLDNHKHQHTHLVYKPILGGASTEKQTIKGEVVDPQE